MSEPEHSFQMEPHLNVVQVREKFFPGKCERWIVSKLKAGEFGTVAKAEREWLIPVSGVLAFLERRKVVFPIRSH